MQKDEKEAERSGKKRKKNMRLEKEPSTTKDKYVNARSYQRRIRRKKKIFI